MPSPPPINPNPLHPAAQLLVRAHSPDTASGLFVDKVIHKPLILRGTSPDPNSQDARAARRLRRLRSADKKAKHRRPKRLTAREKRKLAIYDIPKEEQRFELFLPLHRLWIGYIREILGLDSGPGNPKGKESMTASEDQAAEKKILSPAGAGPVLATADYHGALLEVVRCRCVDRVGIQGIVCKDTKFTFEMVTKENEIKVVPKEHTIFQFKIPCSADWEDKVPVPSTPADEQYVFELQGSSLRTRAIERATKKFKLRNFGV